MMGGNGIKLHERRFSLDIRNNFFFLRNSDSALAQAAQAGVGSLSLEAFILRNVI